MNSQLATTQAIVPLKIRLHPSMRMTDEQFFDFCQLNKLREYLKSFFILNLAPLAPQFWGEKRIY